MSYTLTQQCALRTSVSQVNPILIWHQTSTTGFNAVARVGSYQVTTAPELQNLEANRQDQETIEAGPDPSVPFPPNQSIEASYLHVQIRLVCRPRHAPPLLSPLWPLLHHFQFLLALGPLLLSHRLRGSSSNLRYCRLQSIPRPPTGCKSPARWTIGFGWR